MNGTGIGALAALAGSILGALVVWLRLRYQHRREIAQQQLQEPKLYVEVSGRLINIADERVERMREDLNEALTRVDSLQAQVEDLQAHVRSVEQERDRLRRENERLTERVLALEDEVAELKRNGR